MSNVLTENVKDYIWHGFLGMDLSSCPETPLAQSCFTRGPEPSLLGLRIPT